MSTDPIARMPATFGALLNKLRVGRGIETVEFARAARLTSTEKLTRLENGDAEPTLTEFFRIAGALNEPPAILLVDLIANWREDSNFEYVYRPRPGDFARLYRLRCYELSAQFHELVKPHGSIDAAMVASRTLNATRSRRRQPLLDHITIYVRLGYVRFKPEKATDQGSPAAGDGEEFKP